MSFFVSNKGSMIGKNVAQGVLIPTKVFNETEFQFTNVRFISNTHYVNILTEQIEFDNKS